MNKKNIWKERNFTQQRVITLNLGKFSLEIFKSVIPNSDSSKSYNKKIYNWKENKFYQSISTPRTQNNIIKWTNFWDKVFYEYSYILYGSKWGKKTFKK